MVADDLAKKTEAVRRFSRFYTRIIGLLQEGLLGSPFSLSEARVLYELAHQETTTASDLTRELGLDAGYLSRILKSFEARGLLARRPSESDGRQSVLSLSSEGKAAFAEIDGGSRAQIGAMLEPLPPGDQTRLVESMATIENLLGGRPPARVPYILRSHQPGDLGWIVSRHGLLYAQEYGWDETFEPFVAGIISESFRDFDAKRERCWIAEKDGENVGTVTLVAQSEEIAKLRLLLVDPRARGLGIGHRLVEECIRFARLKGYRKITLWTNDVLVEARRIYERAGFELVEESPHHSFGKDLVGQTWDLAL